MIKHQQKIFDIVMVMMNVSEINKFGVHFIGLDQCIDTGDGRAFSTYKVKTYDHEYFIKNYKKTKEYKHYQKIVNEEMYDFKKEKGDSFENAVKYIQEKEQKEVETQDAVVIITIINHAYPIVQLENDSLIVCDGKIIWSHQDTNIQEIERPITSAKLPALEMKSVKSTLDPIYVDGNSYNYFFAKTNYQLGYGLKFGDNKNCVKRNEIHWLSDAPGGYAGHLPDDGKSNEKWFEAGKLYHLQITISPGEKNPKSSFSERNPGMYYPFFPKNTGRNSDRITYLLNEGKNWPPKGEALIPDIQTAIFLPKNKNMTYMEMIDKRAWENEEYFGIVFDWLD